ncbi:hypothetical protein GQ42DRAFT_132307 [Ramicandelaber brevisporus]|nr:hypothetical protein GQ42DRAFT_132307 [Ramicandelaber brevisporus]
MRILCRQQLREHYQHVPTLDDLVNTVTPTAQATVPEPIKAEMLKEIKSALLSKIPESVLVV